MFAALIFSFVFEKRTGLLNKLLHALSSSWNIDFPWLQDHVMWTLILIGLWLYVGLNMVYFLAALQNVSPDLVDAANRDERAVGVATVADIEVHPGVRGHRDDDTAHDVIVDEGRRHHDGQRAAKREGAR
ncbi:MAG: sugar ABC transporter permease, partial [Aquincola sp.]|nr:sugar ABC transporter permease [Aquincola sp.]